MKFDISSEKAQSMANVLRKKIETLSEPVTHDDALGLLARMFDQPDWATFSELLKATEVTPAQVKVETPFDLYCGAFALDEYGDSPEWVKIKIDQAFVNRVLELQATCINNQLSHTANDGSDLAHDWESEDDYRLQGIDIEVSKTDFWLKAYPKHANYAIKSWMFQISDLVAACQGNLDIGRTMLWHNGDLFYATAGNPKSCFLKFIQTWMIQMTRPTRRHRPHKDRRPTFQYYLKSTFMASIINQLSELSKDAMRALWGLKTTEDGTKGSTLATHRTSPNTDLQPADIRKEIEGIVQQIKTQAPSLCTMKARIRRLAKHSLLLPHKDPKDRHANPTF